MNILVADDEKMQRDMLADFLKRQGYDLWTAENGAEAVQIISKHPIQMVLLDHRMPDMNGDVVLAEMKKIDPTIRAIMITAYGSVETAVEVMKLGADDFLEKPVDLPELLEKLKMAEQRMAVSGEAADVAEALDQSELPIKFIGTGPAMLEVLSLIRRLAPTPWAVLIRGETGTGKELAARLIHMLSDFASGPFIEVNCGAIPETLFESELFGHVKGAFTGASNNRKGRFELAESGTIFLDEIGEMPLVLQPKLLRALQEKRITPVGSEKDIAVDTRIVAATNRDLKQKASQGQFREDLFYRLNVFDLELPPLRHRREDIPVLVDHFMEKYCLQPVRFDPEALNTLIKYPFPGNVRELEHIIQRTVTLARSNRIGVRDLPMEVRYQQAGEQGNLAERLAAMEKEMILSALEKAGGVQTKAAKRLGISERVIRYKMAKYGLKSSNEGSKED